jgi:hypothetical protein
MSATADIQPYLTPSRVGQGTAVEQSRAVAEVQAAVIVAQQCPRSIDRAVRDMQRSCAQRSLAERAFFRYSRGGNQISGPSVQLARELARCFGNTQYGIVELRRDDGFGQSEMLGFAWDLETNTRSSTTFIVPHVRDTKDGAKPLTDMRDIYENNANNGARRLREMIFAILPGWYTEDAVAGCYRTLAADDRDGSTMDERIKRASGMFAELGITAAQLEQKLGAPSAKWSPHDLAQLRVIYRSLERGEIRKEDEFPSARAAGLVTVTEIIGGRGAQAAPAQQRKRAPGGTGDGENEPAPAGSAGPAEPDGDREPGSADPAQIAKIQALYQSRFGFARREGGQTLAISEKIIGRELTGPKDGRMYGNLSAREASELLGKLEGFGSRDELTAFLAPRDGAGDGGDGEASGQ